MYKRKSDYLCRTVMSINTKSKQIAKPALSVREKITEDEIESGKIAEDDIELIVYSFLVHERNKLPKLKPKDERYIIFRVHGELFIVTGFSPLYMLQYADKVMITREIIVNGNIESEETDEFIEPGLRDIKDKHIINWLFDNRQLWTKEVVQCLQRA
jgi:hypothetical protein